MSGTDKDDHHDHGPQSDGPPTNFIESAPASGRTTPTDQIPSSGDHGDGDGEESKGTPIPDYHPPHKRKSLASTFHSLFSTQPESHQLKKNYVLPPHSAPLLGSGGFSTVVKAFWKVGKVDVAIKVVPKTGIINKEDYLKILEAESHFVHPHVVRLYEWFESRTKYYVVFELAQGGELFDKIIEKGRFTEEEAKSAVTAILDSIHYIHTRGVIHRDIKPENFLYRNRSNPKDFVITDFGLAKVLDEAAYGRDRRGEEMVSIKEVCGTPGYAAPEVYRQTGYGFKSDVFGVGVVTFALLSGCSPWQSRSPVDLVHETLEDKAVGFPDLEWSDISDEAKDFIKSLMEGDPGKRPYADEALQHKWLTTPSAQSEPLVPTPVPTTNPPQMEQNGVTKVPVLSGSASAQPKKEDEPRGSKICEEECLPSLTRQPTLAVEHPLARTVTSHGVEGLRTLPDGAKGGQG